MAFLLLWSEMNIDKFRWHSLWVPIHWLARLKVVRRKINKYQSPAYFATSKAIANLINIDFKEWDKILALGLQEPVWRHCCFQSLFPGFYVLLERVWLPIFFHAVEKTFLSYLPQLTCAIGTQCTVKKPLGFWYKVTASETGHPHAPLPIPLEVLNMDPSISAYQFHLMLQIQ